MDIKSKKKDFIRSQKKIISEAVVGINTTLTGLTTRFYYGLRIQDKEVSLHVPDVANIVGVYESIDTLDPVLDKLVFIQGLQLRSTAIVGERVVGGTTGAVAQITDRPSDTQIEISYLIYIMIIGLIIGSINLIVINFILDFTLYNYLRFFYYIALASLIFGSMGAIVGFLSYSWETQQGLFNFFITPVSLLSGTFFSISSIENNLKNIFLINPFYYLVGNFRKSFEINSNP